MTKMKLNREEGDERKRGFTLLELIIVILIIGILATLGFAQYGRMMERSRGAEARMVCGSIRTMAAAYWLEKRNMLGWDNTAAGIGNATADPNKIPGPALGNCSPRNYFVYQVSVPNFCLLIVTALRCNASGKAPQGNASNYLTLTTNFCAGSDTWGGTGGY